MNEMRRSRHARSAGRPGRNRLFFHSLEPRQLLAVDLELLRDINTTSNTQGSDPSNFVAAGSITYFTASTPEAGAEV